MNLLHDAAHPRFGKEAGNACQSPDYDGAANKVEITVNSGAGNVEVNTM